MKRRNGLTALVAGGVAAATTANAVKPFATKGTAAVPSFASGLLTSELPRETAALQVATLAGLAATGRVHGITGRLATLATLGSLAGLATLDRVAARSGEVLEAALVEALGADYRNALGTYEARPVGAPLRRVDVRVRFKADRRQFVRGPVLTYGDAGRRNELDVWRRSDLRSDAAAPVLLQIHGGAWTIGKKETQGVPLMKHLAAQGWVCVAINYRLSPRDGWPAHIIDVKRAIAWIRANIADHGGNPDFVAITGGSAGGHLASLAALTPNVAAYQPGFEEVDTTLQAAVPFYGVYDFTNRDGTGGADLIPLLEEKVFKTTFADDREAWELASPMSHVGPDAPPMFLLHGTNDSLVPLAQARSMVQMLRTASNQTVAYAEMPKAQHAFDILGSVRAAHTARAVGRFLSHTHASWATSELTADTGQATERSPAM